MKLHDINPYVRFVRIQKQLVYTHTLYALDNRIFYCIDGNGSIVIDGDEIPVSKGTLVYWRDSVPYRFITSDNPPVYIGVNFDFSQERCEVTVPMPPVKENDYTESMLIDDKKIDDEKLFNKYFVINNAFIFESKFSELEKEYTGKQIYYMQKCKTILLDILTTALVMYGNKDNTKTEKLTNQVISYIKKNYNKNITYKDIADELHYHPNYISRLLLKQTGMTLHKYLIKYRISKAITLLQATNYSVEKVAETVGISDVGNFSKLFKKHTGSSPSKYKNSFKVYMKDIANE